MYYGIELNISLLIHGISLTFRSIIIDVYINQCHDSWATSNTFSQNISCRQIKYIDYVWKYMLIENKAVRYSPPTHKNNNISSIWTIDHLE